MARPKKNKVSLADVLNESMIALRASAIKKKTDQSHTGFMDFEALDSLDKKIDLKLEHFGLEYVFGGKDLKPGTMIEIIGPEQIGKTTFLFTLCGYFMRYNNNIPFLYINSEGKYKMPDATRICSCISSDRKEAKSILKNQFTMLNSYSLNETFDRMSEWAAITRSNMTKAGIDFDTPIIIAIDTLSKLMSTNEAASVGYTDKNAKSDIGGGVKDSTSKTKKDNAPKLDLTGGSNFDFSKVMHKYSRLFVDIFQKYNATLILISHQNLKIDMMGGFMKAGTGVADNKTKIGGRGSNQSAATQITLTPRGSIKHKTTKQHLSHIVKAKCVKNSRNTDQRSFVYELRTEQLQHTSSELERAINFDYGLLDLFAERKLFGTTCSGCNSGFVKCKQLTGTSDAVSRQEFADLLNTNREVYDKAGSLLGIRGYDPLELDESALTPMVITNNSEASDDGFMGFEDLEDDNQLDDTSTAFKKKNGELVSTDDL